MIVEHVQSISKSKREVIAVFMGQISIKMGDISGTKMNELFTVSVSGQDLQYNAVNN